MPVKACSENGLIYVKCERLRVLRRHLKLGLRSYVVKIFEFLGSVFLILNIFYDIGEVIQIHTHINNTIISYDSHETMESSKFLT